MRSLAKPDWRAKPRFGRARSILGGALCGIGGLATLLVVVAAAGYLRLLAGPVDLQSYSGSVADALAERLGAGWRVTLGGTTLEMHGRRPAVRTADLEIRNPEGATVLRAPYGLVSLDIWSLASGTVSPREIELRDLQLRAVIAPDGTLTFMSGETDPTSVSAARPDVPSGTGRSPVSGAVASLLNPVVEGTGLIGALDHATVKGARLTLVGPDGRERAAFSRVDAEFHHLASGDRQVALDLAGANGAWSVRGRVAEGKNRRADLEITSVPAADLLLLAGVPAGPVRPDLTFGAQVSTVFRTNRLVTLDASFESSAGSIARDKGDPVRIDRVAGRASWNETKRELDLGLFEIASAGTSARFSGRLSADPEGGWRIAMSGRDAKVAGIKDIDRPFAIDEVAADLLVRDGGLAVERWLVRGPDLDMSASGAVLPAPDGYRIQGLLETRRTDLRRLVRLWPDTLNPGLRRYLAARTDAGLVDRLTLRSALTPFDVANLFNEVPLTEGALELDFAASGIGLLVVDGIPSLRSLSVAGRATGTQVALKAPDGRLVTADGRSLVFSEGSYVHARMDVPNSAAQIGFSITGGADALASLLRAPALKEGIGLDIDPAGVRGRAEIKVRLPLIPKRVPVLSELALNIKATLTDVQVDKLLGRDRLEGGNFQLSYDAGELAGRGEAKLGGSQAAFEISAPRTGPGEAVVSLTLDEPARARRSLPVAPQLSGPVPVRVTVPIGGGTKPLPRVEADLGRAAVDGLIPGWVKPANRPGRLSFVLAEGEGGATELRDVTADGGAALLKGQLSLAASGGVEKAEFTTFRLSPGDDMRAQVERAQAGPYRVTLKGNNGDARPILKWISSPAKGGSRDGQDVDVELGLNILTGYNDEALTGVAAKAQVRGGELRSAQFGGKFRGAPVEASLVKRDSGAPVLAVRSADAGATLRFLDVYKRMIGGRLAIDGRSGEAGQSGTITVDEFGLRDEPALRNLVAQATQQASIGNEDRNLPAIARQGLDQVPFVRLAAGFRRSGSRFDFNDVSIYGAQVGFNVSGFIDFARDRLDLGGTFVPAFMLNNAFSHLPVVGAILGGGATEGLIAVDFRVSGPTASPNLVVNPLTAVTPGILRKLFGWMLPPEGEATAADHPSARSSGRTARGGRPD